ncbi:MAG: hypothetical protein H6577_20420 [Lewinellaceae bacterium]|nr:hypothetical protein [Lewinellaceae bacterium]
MPFTGTQSIGNSSSRQVRENLPEIFKRIVAAVGGGADERVNDGGPLR